MAAAASEACYTVQDAAKLGACTLRLAHRKLAAVPAGLAALTRLTSLDLSDNPLGSLQPGCLPATLKQLVLTGCALSGALPAGLLTRLTALEQLVAAANSIQDASAVFACQHLLHAGLAYNHMSTVLPSSVLTPQLLRTCPIMCLDLSHNDLTDLPSTLQQLAHLSKLRALHLRGNPISLLPHYKSAVLQHLPQLVYLDGQKLCDRTLPSAAPAPPAAAAAAAPTDGAAAAAPDTGPLDPPAAAVTSSSQVALTLELDKLDVTEPAAAVFKALADRAGALLHDLQQSQHQNQLQQQQTGSPQPSRPATASSQTGTAAAATSRRAPAAGQRTSATGTAARPSQGGAADTVASSNSSSSSSGGGGGGEACSSSGSGSLSDVPLLPLRYHLELVGPDGAGICSTALVVPAPLQAGPSAAAASGPGASSAAAAADNKKGSLLAAKGTVKAVQDAKTAAAATSAAAKARPGSSARPSVAAKGAAAAEAQQSVAASTAEAAALQAAGRLRVQLLVPADVATRDWLRSGFDVRLVRTQQQPQPVLLAPEHPAASSADGLAGDVVSPAADTVTAQPQLAVSAAVGRAPVGKPGGKAAGAANTSSSSAGSKQASTTATKAGHSSSGSNAAAAVAAAVLETPIASAPPPTVISWTHVPQQQPMGTARVAAPDLLEAAAVAERHSSTAPLLEAAGSAVFVAPAPLLHPVTGIRLGLEEAKQLQLQQPAAGTCCYRLVLG